MSSIKLCDTKLAYKRSGMEVLVVNLACMRPRQEDSKQAQGQLGIHYKPLSQEIMNLKGAEIVNDVYKYI